MNTRLQPRTIGVLGGFAALISVIVIGLVLLALVTTGGSRSINDRIDALNDEAAAAARESALGCAAIARLALASNPNWMGDEAVQREGATCQISAVRYANGEYYYRLTASSSGSVRAYAVALRGSDLKATSFTPIDPLPP